MRARSRVVLGGEVEARLLARRRFTQRRRRLRFPRAKHIETAGEVRRRGRVRRGPGTDDGDVRDTRYRPRRRYTPLDPGSGAVPVRTRRALRLDVRAARKPVCFLFPRRAAAAEPACEVDSRFSPRVRRREQMRCLHAASRGVLERARVFRAVLREHLLLCERVASRDAAVVQVEAVFVQARLAFEEARAVFGGAEARAQRLPVERRVVDAADAPRGGGFVQKGDVRRTGDERGVRLGGRGVDF
mmetsp:Transcript_9113/g.38297  ORF Transcript_9113/g.38297 Transcript_9113/m.38297 type:complete len:244 (+) Transcript_9113:319-1050(+)